MTATIGDGGGGIMAHGRIDLPGVGGQWTSMGPYTIWYGFYIVVMVFIWFDVVVYMMFYTCWHIDWTLYVFKNKSLDCFKENFPLLAVYI